MSLPLRRSRSTFDPRRMAGVLAALVAVMTAQIAPAANYYFSASGNDLTGNGSQAKPWQSIGKFNAVNLQPGDNALFRAGDVFSGKMWLDANDGGNNSAGNLIAPVTISSYGAVGATTRAKIISPVNGEGFVAYNNGGIHLSNLEFQSGGFTESGRTNGVRFLADINSSSVLKKYQNIRVDNVVSHGFGLSGIQVWAHKSVGYNDVQIKNSELYNNGYAGAYIGATLWANKFHSNVTVDNVSAHNNPGFFSQSLPYTGHGVIMANVNGGVIQNSVAFDNGHVNGNGNVGLWTYQSNAVTIQKNLAYGNRSPTGLYDGGAFDIDGGVTNSVIQYNRSYDNDGAGLLLAEYQPTVGMSKNVFRYNLSVNDGRGQYGGITISGADSLSLARSAVFHNNTIVVDRNVVPNAKGAVWFISGNHDDLSFINNSFVALNGAPLIAGDTSTDLSSFVGNSYWTDGATPILEDVPYGSVRAWSMASLQERSSNSYVGITADPEFANEVDYRLSAGSPLIDAGREPGNTPWPTWLVNLGGSDLGGVPLVQGDDPDVGAWESVVGDLNYDGFVDAADLPVWSGAYTGGSAAYMGDLNGDGHSDGDDFLLWQRRVGSGFNQTAASGADAAPVPEPTAAALALTLAALGAWRNRRRR